MPDQTVIFRREGMTEWDEAPLYEFEGQYSVTIEGPDRLMHDIPLPMAKLKPVGLNSYRYCGDPLLGKPIED